MPRYEQIIEGKWTEWKDAERWVCCDCALVHVVERRTRKGKLEVRMFRNNRSTAMYRRHEGIEIVKRKQTKSGKHKFR